MSLIPGNRCPQNSSIWYRANICYYNLCHCSKVAVNSICVLTVNKSGNKENHNLAN